jgi:transcriptional regulator with XRE-family HTH domain
MVRVSPLSAHPRDVRRRLDLSRERMARLFDVSAKTVERWESRESPPPSPHVRRRLVELQEIAELGHVVYTPEGFTLFLTTPFPTFDGRTALQMIEAGQADRVIAALAEDYEGAGF